MQYTLCSVSRSFSRANGSRGWSRELSQWRCYNTWSSVIAVTFSRWVFIVFFFFPFLQWQLSLFPHSLYFFGTSIEFVQLPGKFEGESAWPYVAEALEMEGLSLSDTEAPKTSGIAWLDILHMRDLAQHEFMTEVFRLSWPNVTKFSKIRFSFFIILTATNRYFTITWNRMSTVTWLTHARNMGEESVRLHSRTIYQQFICREFSYKFWQSAWPKECLPNLDNTIMYNPGQKS